jgi:hypothetical protein
MSEHQSAEIVRGWHYHVLMERIKPKHQQEDQKPRQPQVSRGSAPFGLALAAGRPRQDVLAISLSA